VFFHDRDDHDGGLEAVRIHRRRVLSRGDTFDAHDLASNRYHDRSLFGPDLFADTHVNAMRVVPDRTHAVQPTAA
jgi:hypothetical protein